MFHVYCCLFLNERGSKIKSIKLILSPVGLNASCNELPEVSSSGIIHQSNQVYVCISNDFVESLGILSNSTLMISFSNFSV